MGLTHVVTFGTSDLFCSFWNVPCRSQGREGIKFAATLPNLLEAPPFLKGHDYLYWDVSYSVFCPVHSY